MLYLTACRDAVKGVLRGAADMHECGSTSNTLPSVNPLYVHSLAYSRDGTALAAAVGDGSIVVLDGTSRACTLRSWVHAAATTHVEFPRFASAADGGLSSSLVVTAGNDGRVLVVDTRPRFNGTSAAEDWIEEDEGERDDGGDGARRESREQRRARQKAMRKGRKSGGKSAAGAGAGAGAASGSGSSVSVSAGSSGGAGAGTSGGSDIGGGGGIGAGGAGAGGERVSGEARDECAGDGDDVPRVAPRVKPSRVLLCIDHTIGPNFVCTSSYGGGCILVADPTPNIAVYSDVARRCIAGTV